MKSSRKKPWSRVRKSDGGWHYKYDFQDLNWNIKRTKRTFNTANECQAFHDALLAQAQKQAKGERPARYFGQALIRYIEETKTKKLSTKDDVSNAMALRWPYHFEGQWYLLEDLPLDDTENGIVTGFKNYLNDLSLVVKRSYIHEKLWHLRKEGDQLKWYEQPNPKDNDRPQPRKEVTNQQLLAKLNKAKGRPPFSPTTLHQRQTLLKTILGKAKRDWRWLDVDLGDYIAEVEPDDGVINFITSKQLEALVNQSDPFFGYLIQGAAYIGWRKENLVGLTWDRVVWPQKIKDDDGELIYIPGYVHIPERKNVTLIDKADRTERRIRTKNGDPLETIITERTETLLRKLWQNKHPDSNVVFHNGEGGYWGDFRKRWTTAKKKAGIESGFRWHDLRHTWATELLNKGVDKHIIKAEQGWKNDKMVDRYAHIQHEARYAALKKASGN